MKTDTKLTLHHMGIFFIIYLIKIKIKIWRITFLKSVLPLKNGGWTSGFHARDDLPLAHWDEKEFSNIFIVYWAEHKSTSRISVYISNTWWSILNLKSAFPKAYSDLLWQIANKPNFNPMVYHFKPLLQTLFAGPIHTYRETAINTESP